MLRMFRLCIEVEILKEMILTPLIFNLRRGIVSSRS